MLALVIEAINMSARLNKISVKIIIYHLITSAIVATINSATANSLRPGMGFRLAGIVEEISR